LIYDIDIDTIPISGTSVIKIKLVSAYSGIQETLEIHVKIQITRDIQVFLETQKFSTVNPAY